MRRILSTVSWLALSAGLLGGCGDQADAAAAEPVDRDMSWSRICIDEDGDLHGAHCSAGGDCDDTDAAIQVGCGACKRPEEGCECMPGTQPSLCTLASDVTDEGSLLCKSGVRYCQDGAWTDCQGVAEYEVPPPGTEWVDEQIEDQTDPETSALRCDPCHELWGELHEAR